MTDKELGLYGLKRSIASDDGTWVSYDLREVERIIGFQMDSSFIKKDVTYIVAVQDNHLPIEQQDEDMKVDVEEKKDEQMVGLAEVQRPVNHQEEHKKPVMPIKIPI